MPRRVTSAQIEEACGALLRVRRRVGVRDVMRHLRELHGASGRTERVAIILKGLQEEVTALPSPPAQQVRPEALAHLQERFRAVEERAVRAEERERRHQDFWAERYAEKLQELERRFAVPVGKAPTVTADQYQRVCQRVAELEQRLAQYESVEPFNPADGPSR